MHRLVIVTLLVSVGCASSPPPAPRVEAPPLVAVEYRADKREAVLERRWEGMPWARACASPCKERLRPDFEYRVGGANIVPSRTFYLRDSTTIHTRAGYRDTHQVGVALVSVGIPLIVLGSILYVAGVKDEGDPTTHGYAGPPSWVGAIGAGIGGLFAATGIYALATSSTTVEIRERAAVARLTLRF